VCSHLPLAWHEQQTVLGFYLSRPNVYPLPGAISVPCSALPLPNPLD